MNWIQLLVLVMGAVASLFCLTVHELSHGLIAYRLGDPTAKLNGRLTLNPIAHIDLVGLFLMLVARVGWAKAVPVDLRNFKNPKRDMALTALAGPGFYSPVDLLWRLLYCAGSYCLCLYYAVFLLHGGTQHWPWPL